MGKWSFSPSECNSLTTGLRKELYLVDKLGKEIEDGKK